MSGKDEQEELGLEAAYAVETPEDNRTLYAAWADTYDTEFIAKTNYVYHETVVDVFRSVTGPDPAQSGTVLDVGCGTGVVGLALRARGFSRIEGIDISPEMLEKAGAKTDTAGSVYQNLHEADLTKPLTLASDSYAGVISVGTFTHGHLGPDALSELLRVAESGARFAIGINSAHFEEYGFADRLASFRESGEIQDYDLTEGVIYEAADRSDPNMMSVVASFTAH